MPAEALELEITESAVMEDSGRALAQLEAIAADKSWTLPAADPKLENFSGQRYYVDLRSAILAHDVAEAMYLLGDKVPETTRQHVRAALELHVFAPMRGAFAGEPEAKTYISWLTAKHNWNAVCLEGVVDAALTFLEDKHDRAVFAAAAEHWGGNYLDSFTGSGYDSEGVNFEGPAPRPLERYAIRKTDDGQIIVDKSRKFQKELGQWEDVDSYLIV